MKKKLLSLCLVVFFFLMISDDLLILLRGSLPHNNFDRKLEIPFDFPIAFVFFLIGAAAFFFMAKNLPDLFYKKFFIIVAINFLIGSISILSDYMAIPFISFPIIPILYLILLIYCIMFLFKTISNEKRKV